MINYLCAPNSRFFNGPPSTTKIACLKAKVRRRQVQYAVNSRRGWIYMLFVYIYTGCWYLHLLSRAFPTGLFSNELEGTVVKSSKFIIIRLMSSTSLRIGAITSEHRNFEPVKEIINHRFLVRKMQLRCLFSFMFKYSPRRLFSDH